MSLYIASLNSGSNGNCYYVGNDNEAVLVDAGLSCREIEKRMRRLGLPLERVKAIFISHEHDDHIRGVEVLSKRFQIPVYITDNTRQHSRLDLEEELTHHFFAAEPVFIGALEVLPFSKTHDAIDPHSFVISTVGTDGCSVCVGVFTDIGHVCSNLTQHFKRCHAAFLESNYDEALLENGRYPWPLKNRIRGGQGHLSNKQALELFIRHRPAFMSHLLLAHLSQDNNRPELALAMFEEAFTGAHVVVASRHCESEVYFIDGKFSGLPGIGEGVISHPAFIPPPASVVVEVEASAEVVVSQGIGHSMIRRRKKALSSKAAQSNPNQIRLF